MFKLLQLALRIRVTITYCVLATAGTIALGQVDRHDRWHVLHEASTNLHNLSDGHLATLVTSVFLTEGRVNWLWLASVALLFAVAEWLSGWRRFLLTFSAGHLGATALVAAGLLVGIHADWLADSLEMAVDVGVSYAAAAVAGSMIRYLPKPARSLWAALWIGVVFVGAVSDPSFTAAGHAIALTIGFGLGAMYLRKDASALSHKRIGATSTDRVQPSPQLSTLV
ncbi:rhomboid-like protein [Rhodococcus sp. KRD162]|uniref:rhomboid-like protein n=1 Tax=unclassified Rhodococcus (in: high G+C Gram-positive bacteria) TaxID=192944 RepID=UPI0019D052FA|nr:rhomboid-like protein [Rhodococcus sp. KRD162]